MEVLLVSDDKKQDGCDWIKEIEEMEKFEREFTETFPSFKQQQDNIDELRDDDSDDCPAKSIDAQDRWWGNEESFEQWCSHEE